MDTGQTNTDAFARCSLVIALTCDLLRHYFRATGTGKTLGPFNRA